MKERLYIQVCKKYVCLIVYSTDFPYHDGIEEEASEWSDEGGRADQPDGADDGHEEHEWGGSLIAILQDYLLYGLPYHDWIEEKDSEWADEGGGADQPDGVDDGHEEHEGRPHKKDTVHHRLLNIKIQDCLHYERHGSDLQYSVKKINEPISEQPKGKSKKGRVARVGIGE